MLPDDSLERRILRGDLAFCMEMAHLRESNCIYDEAKYVMHAHGNDDMRETAHAFYPNAGSERARASPPAK